MRIYTVQEPHFEYNDSTYDLMGEGLPIKSFKNLEKAEAFCLQKNIDWFNDHRHNLEQYELPYSLKQKLAEVQATCSNCGHVIDSVSTEVVKQLTLEEELNMPYVVVECELEEGED